VIFKIGKLPRAQVYPPEDHHVSRTQHDPFVRAAREVHLADQALEGQLADQELGRLLVPADLTECDEPARPITLSCQGCIPSAPQEEGNTRAIGKVDEAADIIGLLISSIIGCCRYQLRKRWRQSIQPMLERQLMPVAMPVATPVATVGAIPCGACETAAHSYALFPLQ
tara:strand:- start:63 stop:569 length:507 start_codon:yes stop_codon:yes gene_type:complete